MSQVLLPRREERDVWYGSETPTVRPSDGCRVGIVGGGFTGSMVLANLVEQAEFPFTVDWFDSGDALGVGVAYGTCEPVHLLNVRADRMGALPGKPADFYQWLAGPEGMDAAARFYPGREITPDCYVPRALYAVYLKHIVARTLETAQRKNIDIRRHRARVTDAGLGDFLTQRITLTVQQDESTREVTVDALVLATGNLPPRPTSTPEGRHYVADVWHPPADSLFPSRLHALPADTPVMILGTGLTMVDSVLTLLDRGYKGKIIALSRHGWLPAVHEPAQPYPAWEWTQSPHTAPTTVRGMLHRLRREVALAEARGYSWRDVIDSLRPVTQQLWKRLGAEEKRTFLRRLITVWNIHRHRMAPEIQTQLRRLQDEGRLEIVAGTLTRVESREAGLAVILRRRGAERTETIRTPLMLNCSGPNYDLARCDHPLLRRLCDTHMVEASPLRAGLQLDYRGRATGAAPDAVFPVGGLLVGELLESTAIPELREQAGKTADLVLQRLKSLVPAEAAWDSRVAAWVL